MGCDVTMEPGKGPVLPRPVATPADVDALHLRPDCVRAFDYLYAAIRETRRKIRALAGIEADPTVTAALPQDAAAALRGREVPIIGFAGGPWTLVSYMIEGGGAKDFSKSKTFLLKYPEASHKLLSAVADVVVELLVEQARAGASLLQVFESHAGELPPSMFKEFALPYLLRIADAVRARLGACDSTVAAPPLIVFPRNAHYSLEWFATSAYDVIGLDWATDPRDAVERIRAAATKAAVPPKAVQGNLDPSVLFAGQEVIRKETEKMLDGFGDHPLIGNLGHGMLPNHSPDALKAYFAALHELSRERRS